MQLFPTMTEQIMLSRGGLWMRKMKMGGGSTMVQAPLGTQPFRCMGVWETNPAILATHPNNQGTEILHYKMQGVRSR